MATDFDFWRLLAGIGLFLFAMAQLEAALRALGGRSLAQFLQRQTSRNSRAVAGASRRLPGPVAALSEKTIKWGVEGNCKQQP